MFFMINAWGMAMSGLLTVDQFIIELRSGKNDHALAAIDKMRKQGWLSDGSLAGVNLWGANLAGANLEGANLIGVNLSAANLTNVNLHLACLNKARLVGANLSGANLYETQFVGTSLRSVEFSEDTILPNGKHWTPDTDIAKFFDGAMYVSYSD